jgi:hypothetical protein
VTWGPLTASEFYLELGEQQRPPFQGDIYADVPFVKAKRGSKREEDPAVKIERRPVALFSYTCDVVADDGYTLRKAQTVALVRPESGDGLPDDWDGCYHLCPLPDLYGNGVMWVVDFTIMTHVDRYYLDSAHRVRCLSELGWTIFRQRAALEPSRGLIDPDYLRVEGAPTWAESLMEMDWLAAGRDQSSFQSWLNSPDEEHCPGFEQRRDALGEDGGIDRVSELLRAELYAMPAVSESTAEPCGPSA